jgi:hypothetical protein
MVCAGRAVLTASTHHHHHHHHHDDDAYRLFMSQLIADQDVIMMCRWGCGGGGGVVM